MQAIRVKTLLGHVRPQSIGIRTSVFGRMAFVAAATSTILWRLRTSPDDCVTPLVFAITIIIAIGLLGAGAFLIGKCIPLVLLSCVMIELVNRYFDSNIRALAGFAPWMCAAARGAAYAALSLATLLVAILTRPSDLARLVSRFGISWNAFLMIAVPFSTTSNVASRFRDIMFVAKSRKGENRHSYYFDVVVRAATSLFAVGIHQAMCLFQVAQACRPNSGSLPNAKGNIFHAPYCAPSDLCFVLILLPSAAAMLVLSRIS